MANGLVLSAQLLVPSHASKAGKARFIWGNDCWLAENSFYNSFSTSYFSKLDISKPFPVSLIQIAPIFFQIDFLRTKLLRYLIVGAVKGTNSPGGDRVFAVGYRNVYGRTVAYSNDNIQALVILSIYSILSDKRNSLTIHVLN